MSNRRGCEYDECKWALHENCQNVTVHHRSSTFSSVCSRKQWYYCPLAIVRSHTCREHFEFMNMQESGPKGQEEDEEEEGGCNKPPPPSPPPPQNFRFRFVPIFFGFFLFSTLILLVLSHSNEIEQGLQLKSFHLMKTVGWESRNFGFCCSFGSEIDLGSQLNNEIKKFVILLQFWV
ncbi:hypothetical protein M0804_009919 [Polistes exclamans]|nr:hypothetical protein M0804_009919 [Polistes exclamans]